MTKIPTEHEEQKALIAWFDMSFPAHKGRLFAVPNGAYKSRSAASHYMREGLRSGVPDLMLPVARGGYHGLFIEMKRQKGGVVSPVQRDWIEYLNAQGYQAVVCRGFDAARKTIEQYLDQ